MPYSFLWTANQLQSDKDLLITDSQDLEATLDNVAMPKNWRDNITGAIIRITDGDYEALWFTEDNAPYALTAIYRPLPYYRPYSWGKKNLPIYWLEECEHYQKEKA